MYGMVRKEIKRRFLSGGKIQGVPFEITKLLELQYALNVLGNIKHTV